MVLSDVFNRPFFLSLLLLAAVLNTQCSNTQEAPKDKNPGASNNLLGNSQDNGYKFNVFLIVSDALRPDVLGCYGGTAHTPNIDWLAANGTLFENSYSTSRWTAPSSVAIFTGNYPTTYAYSPYATKSIKFEVPDKEELFAEVLNGLGYLTKDIVENPNAGLHNNLQGFENIGHRREVEVEQTLSEDRKKEISAITLESIYQWPNYRTSYVWADELLSLRNEQPFFFVQWFVDPHSPYEPDPEFRERIVVDTSRLPRPLTSYSKVLSLQTENYTGDEIKFNKDLYLAEVESIDDRVGIIVDTMKARGLLDRTYIIFTSDHGEQFGEHGQTGHGSFGKNTIDYDVLLRVPLIVMGPGVDRNARRQEPISLLGLMPTMKDMLRVRYQETMQGKSFSALFSGKSYTLEPLYFCSDSGEQSKDAMLSGGYKLIVRQNLTSSLFNVNDDPKEEKNIADENPDIVTSLTKGIEQMRDENKIRLERNSRLPAKGLQQSNEELRETVKSLKELGYTK